MEEDPEPALSSEHVFGMWLEAVVCINDIVVQDEAEYRHNHALPVFSGTEGPT